MTKRRKLVPTPVSRVKTEVKEEKVTAGKNLYIQNYLFEKKLSLTPWLFAKEY
jgi:hypothetical protein